MNRDEKKKRLCPFCWTELLEGCEVCPFCDKVVTG